MSASSIHGKTIRPGSLSGYSTYYYHSNRQLPASYNQPKAPVKQRSHRKLIIMAAVILTVGFIGFNTFSQRDSTSTASTTQQQPATPVSPKASKAAPAAVAATPAPNRCAGNELDKLIKIDVSEQHLWACEGGKQVHDAAVITGNEQHESTHTPRGEYKIYGKTTNTTLTGSDVMGAWKMPVYFWMPFLDNEHGTYGFHDATWRGANEFGKIDPNTDKASHGCVELTKDDAGWIYNWAPTGTVLRVED